MRAVERGADSMPRKSRTRGKRDRDQAVQELVHPRRHGASPWQPIGIPSRSSEVGDRLARPGSDQRLLAGDLCQRRGGRFLEVLLFLIAVPTPMLTTIFSSRGRAMRRSSRPSDSWPAAGRISSRTSRSHEFRGVAGSAGSLARLLAGLFAGRCLLRLDAGFWRPGRTVGSDG